METRTDPGARDPSPPLLKLVRAVVAGLVASGAAWLVAHGILNVESRGPVEDAAMLLLMGLLMAFGAHARDRGWFIGKFIALALVLGLAGPIACKTATPREAWGTALATYSAAAAGMAVYCDLPDADADSCIKAARATLVAEPIIAGTQEAIRNGTASEGLLESSTSRLGDLTTTVEEAR